MTTEEQWNSLSLSIKQRLFRGILLVTGSATLVVAVLNLINGMRPANVLIPFGCTVFCAISWPLAAVSRRNLLIQWIFFGFFNLLYIPLGWFTSPGSISAMPFYAMLIIMMSTVLAENAWRLVLPVISMVETILLFQYEKWYPEFWAAAKQDYDRLYDLSLSFLVVCLMIFFFFWRINRSIDKERKTLYELSVVDQLTRLYNRRYLMDSLKAMINASHRGKDKFSIIVFDVDNFKKVNDLYGHQEGDAVLQYLADLMKRHSRSYDICGRYGGDEFMVIMPGGTRDQAVTYAERVLHLFLEYALKYRNANISFSFGVSESFGDDFYAVIAAADRELYRMKDAMKARRRNGHCNNGELAAKDSE